MSTLPHSGATELVSGQAVPETAVNEALRHLDAGHTRVIVKDRDLTAPPGTCSDGTRFLVAAGATGAWSGEDGLLAIAVGENASNGWLFEDIAAEGFRMFVRDEGVELQHNGTDWEEAGSILSGPTEWDITFTAAGDAYIAARVAMTIDEGVASIGTGTLAYAKSTTAAPSTFSATTLPATLEAGARLKISASSITGFVTAHYERTA